MVKAQTLSIVIPVYNEEDHIEACLDTIAAQTEMPLEVIVVDNNCTDETVNLASRYPFVRIVKESKQGIVHARNAGFNAARGNIIGRIDADSRLPDDWVETGIKFIAANHNSLLTGGSYMYDFGYPRLFGWVQENIAFRANKLILGQYIAWGSNSVFHKDLWLAVRNKLHTDADIHEDMDLGLHLTESGFEVIYDKHRKVGIESRLFSEKRKTRAQHFKYLKMWPNTLHRHQLKRAWMGTLGAYMLYYMYVPLLIMHLVGKVFGRPLYADEFKPD